MPAPDYASYPRKVLVAARRADANATPAQREAGVARVGKVWAHGLEISIEVPKGGVRTGTSADGKTWQRVLRNHYGYINKTRAADGEHLDVWLGDCPETQLGFLVEFLTGAGEHDEYKLVLGVANLAEARKVLADNYPDDFVDARVGEVRGFFLPQLRTWLARERIGLWKPRQKSAVDLTALIGLGARLGKAVAHADGT